MPLIRFNVIEDAYLYSDDPDNNRGGQEMGLVGYWNNSRYMLGKFDFSSLPHGVAIRNAKLYVSRSILFPSENYNGSPVNPLNMSLHIVTGEWNEGTVTYNTRPEINSAASVSNWGFAEIPDGTRQYEYADITDMFKTMLSGGHNSVMLKSTLEDHDQTFVYVYSKENVYEGTAQGWYIDVEYGLPIKIAPDTGLIDKQVMSMQIAPANGPINKKAIGMKIYDGVRWKKVF